MADAVDRRRTTIRNLVVFSGVVLGVGWVGHGLDLATGSPSTEGPGILLWLVTPLLASLALRAFAGDGWDDFGLRPGLAGNVPVYVVALLVYPALTGVVLGLGWALGPVSFPDLSWAAVGVVLQAFAADALPQLVKNVFEEGAWRGYLAPRIYSLPLNEWLGHGLVGIVWGAWHLPYYLFFLDRGLLAHFTTLELAGFVPLAIGTMVAWATVYGEIRLLTGSFWPAVLMHMVEDAFLNQLFLDGHVEIAAGADWLVSPVNGILGMAVWIAAAVGLRRWRLSREGEDPHAAEGPERSGA